VTGGYGSTGKTLASLEGELHQLLVFHIPEKSDKEQIDVIVSFSGSNKTPHVLILCSQMWVLLIKYPAQYNTHLVK